MSHSVATTVPGEQQAGPLLFLRVFLPFAAAYFLSYVFRTVNAVIAPDLVAGTGLSASELGFLTSTYFLAFAVFQLPLGMLLDRFGPRRVEAALLLVAALGAVLFARADTAVGLGAARALIGVGVSCCLMAGFKAFVLWFPRDRVALVNGALLAFGGFGALAATVPVEWALKVTDWRGLFLVLGALTALVAIVLAVFSPEHRGRVADVTLRDQLRGLRQVFRDPFFWRVAPVAAVALASSVSIQGLWAGPWLRDVAGLDRGDAATHLMVAAATMCAGHLLMGALAQRLSRLGLRPLWLAGAGMTGLLVITLIMALGVSVGSLWLMAAFGFFATASSLSYALLSQHFPAGLAGRANTGQNVMVFGFAFLLQWGLGAVIGYWENPITERYATEGYLVGFGALAVVQLISLFWFFLFSGRARA